MDDNAEKLDQLKKLFTECLPLIKDDIREAIESGKWTDYAYNGVDEYAVDAFDTDEAMNNLIKLFSK